MLKPKRRCSFPAFVIAPEAFHSGSKSESVQRGRSWSRVSTVSLDRPADRRALPRNRLWCCDTVSPHQNGTRTNTTPKLKELVEAFKKLGDQKLRVQQLLHMAATLPPFPRERRVLGKPCTWLS
ncbi:hypothetical protein F1559_001851 [Cyanidiococcus yangmingshanensis]|uniref:Uncharacterized protein n=1 Tax=Cyanidiococcus yangmingshanensis TaxID=2690220 RepID=A0A7J7IDF3_9RHOD|nr:hypothetical protein F1559_001851 [Cyanidiococcus yangmingshanensis]